jgi:hypothetical protein
MQGKKRLIKLQISGWTYIVSFPYRAHDHEMIVCSGHALLDCEGRNERRDGLFLEITRKKNDEEKKSTYRITEDAVDVSIQMEKDDFYRFFIELKEHYKIAECRMNLDFEGPVETHQTFEFEDFEVMMNVDRNLNA